MSLTCNIRNGFYLAKHPYNEVSYIILGQAVIFFYDTTIRHLGFMQITRVAQNYRLGNTIEFVIESGTRLNRQTTVHGLEHL